MGKKKDRIEYLEKRLSAEILESHSLRVENENLKKKNLSLEIDNVRYPYGLGEATLMLQEMMGVPTGLANSILDISDQLSSSGNITCTTKDLFTSRWSSFMRTVESRVAKKETSDDCDNTCHPAP